jgi:hypothetical protein
MMLLIETSVHLSFYYSLRRRKISLNKFEEKCIKGQKLDKYSSKEGFEVEEEKDGKYGNWKEKRNV